MGYLIVESYENIFLTNLARFLQIWIFDFCVY